jgi:hypothetical protein
MPIQQPLGAASFGSPPLAPSQGGSWSTGLFGNIAATAAGVVAGSFLFQGFQELMNRNESAPLDPHASTPPDELGTLEGRTGDMFADFDDSGDFT